MEHVAQPDSLEQGHYTWGDLHKIASPKVLYLTLT